MLRKGVVGARIVLQLIIVTAGGLLIILAGMASMPWWAFAVAVVLWVTVGVVPIAKTLRRGMADADQPTWTSDASDTIRRQPNVVLRWLIIVMMVPVALFVLLGGLFVQYVMTGALAVISPALPFWAFLCIAALWATVWLDGLIRALRNQL
jgi:hypothetical protein